MTTVTELYEAPTMTVIELKTQSIICQSLTSPAGVQNYNWNTFPIE